MCFVWKWIRGSKVWTATWLACVCVRKRRKLHGGEGGGSYPHKNCDDTILIVHLNEYKPPQIQHRHATREEHSETVLP